MECGHDLQLPAVVVRVVVDLAEQHHGAPSGTNEHCRRGQGRAVGRVNPIAGRHAGMDIGELIPRHALYRPNHTAVVFAGERFT